MTLLEPWYLRVWKGSYSFLLFLFYYMDFIPYYLGLYVQYLFMYDPI
jgi:hypothetical protein